MGWSMNKYGNIFWQYVVSRRRLLYLVVIFFDGRFGLCLSLPETGTVFLYATLMLGFFYPLYLDLGFRYDLSGVPQSLAV